MFDVSRILAIPDESVVDYLQCGISGSERAALAARGFVRKDGTKAKDYMIRTIKKTEKVGIKGDKPMSAAIAEKTSTKSATSKATTGNPESDSRYERLQNKKYKTATEENALKMYESQMKADPSKFAEGDGVGFRVMVQGRSSQINRGFQVVSVDKKSKTALVKQVRDTGLTATGGNYDRIKPMVVHVADLVRDGSKAKKSSVTPAIATPSKPETKPEKASNAVKLKPPAIAATVQPKELVTVQQKSKASNSFEANLKRNLADNLKTYKNPKVQKKLSPQAFEGYAKQDVKEGIVAKTRRKIIDNTTKLVSPLKEKGRLLTSSKGTISRKKREMSGADIARNLESKGQLNIFNQPKPSPSTKISPETAKKIKSAIPLGSSVKGGKKTTRNYSSVTSKLIEPSEIKKNLKVGDDVTSTYWNNYGYSLTGGRIKSIARTKAVVEYDYMGKPSEKTIRLADIAYLTRRNGPAREIIEVKGNNAPKKVDLQDKKLLSKLRKRSKK